MNILYSHKYSLKLWTRYSVRKLHFCGPHIFSSFYHSTCWKLLKPKWNIYFERIINKNNKSPNTNWPGLTTYRLQGRFSSSMGILWLVQWRWPQHGTRTVMSIVLSRSAAHITSSVWLGQVRNGKRQKKCEFFMASNTLQSIMTWKDIFGEINWNKQSPFRSKITFVQDNCTSRKQC
jgi:hypothetical protein